MIYYLWEYNSTYICIVNAQYKHLEQLREYIGYRWSKLKIASENTNVSEIHVLSS